MTKHSKHSPISHTFGCIGFCFALRSLKKRDAENKMVTQKMAAIKYFVTMYEKEAKKPSRQFMISLLRAKLGRGKMMYIAHSYIIYECCEIFLVAVAREKERERSDSFGGILPEMKIHCYAIHRSVNNNAIQIYADERMYCQVIIMLFQLLLHCCSLSTTEHITYATIFYPNDDKTQ